MAYIGSTPTSQNFISGTDYFNGTGSQTAFTLTRSVNSVNDVEVVVNNVIQQPNSYTVVGTTLTLSAAPSSGTSNVYVRYLATNQQSFTVPNNSIGYNQLTTDLQADFGMKNRIINGAMIIDQRNAGASITPTASAYTVDRWQFQCTQASKVRLQQQSSAANGPVGFTNYLGMTSLSAYSVLTGDFFALRQSVEGFNTVDLQWGTARAKTVTISFWVNCTLTGTFGGSLVNNVNNRSYPFTYTISAANTWEYKTITIPGDTTGTWVGAANGVGLTLFLGLGAGATYSGTVGSWQAGNFVTATGATSLVGTNGAVLYLTGVQLEVGSQATGFEYRQYQQELALCQRYYQKTTGGYGLISYSTAGTTTNYVLAVSQLPVVMRTTPTVVIYNGTTANQCISMVNNGSFAGNAVTPYSYNAMSPSNVYVTLYGTATYGVRGDYTADAEL